MSTPNVVRIGLVGQTLGLIYIGIVMSDHITFLGLLPGLVIYGLASGFAFSQLTNVILSDIPGAKAGVASGTNTTLRQVGNALGIAVIGTIVTAQTVSRAMVSIKASTDLSASERGGALAGIHALGANYTPPSAPAHAATTLNRIMGHAVTGATRDSIFYALVVVTVGTALSFLIPNVGAPAPSIAEDLAALGPLDAEAEFESEKSAGAGPG